MASKRKVLKVCKNNSSYAAEFPPKCNCVACTDKWQAAQAARVKKANSPAFIKKHGLVNRSQR